MEGLISFPNAVCLVLAGLLVTHLLSLDRTASTPQWPDHPEDSYCCLGPPHSRPAATCSSPASIFYACASQRPSVPDERNRTEELENESENETEEEQVRALEREKERDNRGEGEGGEEVKEEEEQERTSLMVDTMVVGLLVCSAAVSLREWYRDRNRTRAAAAQRSGVEGAGGGGAAGGGANGRRISLADLTFNRHVRRGETHPHPYHHAGTPSGASGSRVPPPPPPPLLRRSSFPAQFPEPSPTRTRPPPPRRQQSSPGLPLPPRRRLSVDLDDDGSSPDRRRVRIIRRH